VAYSIIPPKSKEFENQTELTPVTDAEVSSATRPFRTTISVFLYQVLCFLIFLGPLRLVFVLVISAFTVCLILTIRAVMGAIGMPRNVHPACVAVPRFGVRCILFSFGIVFVKTSGHAGLSARFVVCNHVGLLDALIVFFLRDVVCAIDRCYRRSRALELVLECVDPIWVDWRTKPDYRKMICDSVDDFGRPPVLIFPEGQSISGCGDVVLRFEKTVFSTPYKVQPMTIRYEMFGVPKTGTATHTTVREFFGLSGECLPFYLQLSPCIFCPHFPWRATQRQKCRSS
jgi:1-acyl-sn-glycerol-3-phosphate acyltransferase